MRNGAAPEKRFKKLMESSDLVQAVVDSKTDTFELMRCRLQIDMIPFTFKAYDDDVKGIKKALEDIRSLVSLTKAEEKQWAQFIKDCND